MKGRRTVGPATRQRIRATLRSAIGTYMKQHPGQLDVNVAALIDLPSGKRPRPLVWTEERVRGWQDDFEARLAAARATGKRVDVLDIYISTPRPSPVMVWTPAQTGVFLAYARRHRLYALYLYHLVVFRGLRRGETCGLRRTDLSLSTGIASVRWQITQLGWATDQGVPKSEAGERQVALDAQTTAVIRAGRRRQEKEKAAAADAWTDSGFEFTAEDGSPLHLAAVTGQFEQLAYLGGLPPIRLHDLRHGAASIAAGHHMKVVQETRGLSSITIAADTYTSVLPELARQSAEDVAALVPISKITATEQTSSKHPRGKTERKAGETEKTQVRGTRTGAPPGTRTPNPRIKRRAR